MNIRVLGCSGAEFPGHNPPGFLLDGEVLFDAGSITTVLDEDEQFKIKNIFITHAHLDHIKGIPFLADNIIVRNTGHTVNIISIGSVLKTIKRNLFNSAVWPDFTILPQPDNAILNLIPVKTHIPITVNDYVITPYKVNHTVPAVGYLVEDRAGKRFFYTGDTGPTDGTWKKIGEKQIHCMIVEVSFPNEMNEMAIRTGHLTAELLRKELLKIKHLPEKIYITHPKPQHFKTIKTELGRLKLKNLMLLRDGQRIRV